MLGELFIELYRLSELLPAWYVPADVLLFPALVGLFVCVEWRLRRSRGW